MYRMCRRCTEDVQKVYRRCTEGRNVQKVLQKVEGKESCMRSHWLVVRPSRHAQTQGTGSKDSLVCLAGWSSDIHIVVSVQRPDRSERPTMGVPVHILLEKPAKGLLHIC